TSKGPTTQEILAGKDLRNTLVVTIGDESADYAMHRIGVEQIMGVAFHVGGKADWDKNPLHQCVCIIDENGNDTQNVDGTLRVIGLIQEAMGKTFEELRFIPQQDATGHVEYRSLKDFL